MSHKDETPASDQSRDVLEHSALLRARALVDRTRSLYHELERSTGLPVQVHRVLGCIAANPGIQSSRLAAELGMQRSAVSHLLKALISKGWIDRRRDERDQRSVHLHVTTAGRGIVSATSGRMVGVLQRAVRRLSDEQLDGLARSLAELLRHISQPMPKLVASRRRVGEGGAGLRRRQGKN